MYYNEYQMFIWYFLQTDPKNGVNIDALIRK